QARQAFLSQVSHELRTPLSVISSATELLKEAKLPSEQRQFLNFIDSSTATMVKLVDDILDTKLIDEDKLELTSELFSLEELIDELKTTHQLYAEKYNVRLEFIGNFLHNQVVGDKFRIKQILSNL